MYVGVSGTCFSSESFSVTVLFFFLCASVISYVAVVVSFFAHHENIPI